MLGSVPRIELDEFDDAERRALIDARFGGAKVPRDVQQAIVLSAGGNPFFLIELVDALLDRGAVWIEGEGDDRRVVRRSGAAFITEWNEVAHPFDWTPQSFDKVLASVHDTISTPRAA